MTLHSVPEIYALRTLIMHGPCYALCGYNMERRAKDREGRLKRDKKTQGTAAGDSVVWIPAN